MDRLRVLRNARFARFFLGFSVSTLGSAMSPVAITFAVLGEGYGAGGVSTVLAAGSAPVVLLLLVGGVGADRWGRRRVMVIADVTRFVATAALAGWLLAGRPPLVATSVLSAIVGAGLAFFSPALTGLVPELVAAEDLAQANALTEVATSLSGTVGPAVGGVLVAAAGAGWAVAGDAISYLVSVGCLIGLPAVAVEAATPFWHSLAAGWRDFRSRTWLWSIVTQFGLFHLLVLPPFLVLGAVIAEQRLGGATAWGAVLAALGVGSVLGSAAMLGRQPRRPLVAATVGVAAMALPMWALAARVDVVGIALAAFAAGVGFGVFGPLWSTTLQREVPAELLSRVSAYDWFGSIALLPIGYALAAPLSAALGVTTVLLAGGAYMLVSSAVVLAIPDVRRIRGGSGAPSAPGEQIPSVPGEQIMRQAGLGGG